MTKPRLIDANDAKKLICGIDSEFAKFVDEIPTAYDIDGVVEQLEELETTTVFDYYEEKFSEYVSLDEAIEIVKGGAE